MSLGITVLRYNSLKSAVPADWKAFYQELVQSAFRPLPPSNYYSSLVESKSLSSKVYKLLLDDVLLIHPKYLKWRQELGEDFSEDLLSFGMKHKDIYRVTNIPKFRSFQYRLLQRGIVTNVLLYKWKIIETETCSFCKEQKETILHLMCRCSKVQELWRQVWTYIKDRFDVQIIDTSDKAIIFNEIVKNRKDHVVNFICLITKQFIYRQKCLKKEIHFPILKAYIHQIESVEKYSAIKNQKLSIHQKKWFPVVKMNNDYRDTISEYIDNM